MALHLYDYTASDTSLCALKDNVLSVSRVSDTVVNSIEWSRTERKYSKAFRITFMLRIKNN